MKVVVINGLPTAGKDEFCNMCKQIRGNYIHSISTVDTIKEIAKMIGWDGIKDGRARKFLSDLKDLTTEFNEFPLRSTIKRVEEIYREVEIYGGLTEKIVVFIHSREPQEINKFKGMLGATTLLIRRPEIENQETTNHADKEVFNYEYDYTIINDGSLEDLYDKAREFLNTISNK